MTADKYSVSLIFSTLLFCIFNLCQIIEKNKFLAEETIEEKIKMADWQADEERSVICTKLRTRISSIDEKMNNTHIFGQAKTVVKREKQENPSDIDIYSKERLIPNRFPELPEPIQDYSIQLPDMKAEYKNRIKRLNTVCKYYSEPPKDLIQQYKDNEVEHRYEPDFFTVPSARILYCALTKCGSSNWKSVLREIDRINTDANYTSHLANSTAVQWSSRKDLDIRIRRKRNRYDGYKVNSQVKTQEEMVDILTDESITKYTFVRDPLERLLSAYRDKVQPGYQDAYRHLHDELWNLMKSEYNKESLLELDTYGFHSFLYGLLLRNGPRHPYPMNDTYFGPTGGIKDFSDGIGWHSNGKHWYRFYDLCHICSIKWTFIGKVETADLDSEEIMKLSGMYGKIHMRLRGRSSDNSKIINYFKGFPKTDVAKIFDLYKEDFDLFGYTVNDWLWEHLGDE